MAWGLTNTRARLAGLAIGVLTLAGCIELPSVGPTVDRSEPVVVALLVPGGSGESGDEVLARITRRAARDLELAVGQPCHMVLKSMSVARDHVRG